MIRFAMLTFGLVLAAPSLILAVVIGLLLVTDPGYCTASNWTVC